jgi:2,4-dienoyl-CoA reductase-like NADH-dependent reductase (Old Yellow Enzyme family)
LEVPISDGDILRRALYESKLASSGEVLERLLTTLVDAEVDLFHASMRRFWVPEFPDSTLNLAGITKKLTGKPAISVGPVGLKGPDFVSHLGHKDPSLSHPFGLDELRTRLEEREFDLIAVGRAIACDTRWAEKIRNGVRERTIAIRSSDA